jgi:uncharacterized protein involved in exopolysaccharide biosynthesis
MHEDNATSPPGFDPAAPRTRTEALVSAAYYAEDEIRLADLLRAMNAQRRLIIAITVAGTVLATVLALVMTPVYRSKALLVPVSQEQENRGLSAIAGQFGGLAQLAGLNFGGGGSSKDEAIALLKSRGFTEQFIRSENLLPVLFDSKWDADQERWKSDDQNEIPTLNDGYRLFDRNVRQVTEDRKTSLVTLTIDWKDRELAARWAQLLVERVNQSMRERAIEESQRSLNYLNQELLKTEAAEVRQAIYRLIETQIKSIMWANVRDQYSFRVLDPPAVADKDDPVRPRRASMIAIGTVLGFFISLLIVFVRNTNQTQKLRSF